jgi:hypothetical protein
MAPESSGGLAEFLERNPVWLKTPSFGKGKSQMSRN